jgi:hypothetical protein
MCTAVLSRESEGAPRTAFAALTHSPMSPVFLNTAFLLCWVLALNQILPISWDYTNHCVWSQKSCFNVFGSWEVCCFVINSHSPSSSSSTWEHGGVWEPGPQAAADNLHHVPLL